MQPKDWTRKPPEEPGFYWFQPAADDASEPFGDITIVEIHDPPDENGKIWLWFLGWETPTEAHSNPGVYAPVYAPHEAIDAAQTLHNNASYEADSSLVFVGVDDYERLMRLLGVQAGKESDA